MRLETLCKNFTPGLPASPSLRGAGPVGAWIPSNNNLAVQPQGLNKGLHQLRTPCWQRASRTASFWFISFLSQPRRRLFKKQISGFFHLMPAAWSNDSSELRSSAAASCAGWPSYTLISLTISPEPPCLHLMPAATLSNNSSGLRSSAQTSRAGGPYIQTSLTLNLKPFIFT